MFLMGGTRADRAPCIVQARSRGMRSSKVRELGERPVVGSRLGIVRFTVHGSMVRRER